MSRNFNNIFTNSDRTPITSLKCVFEFIQMMSTNLNSMFINSDKTPIRQKSSNFKKHLL